MTRKVLQAGLTGKSYYTASAETKQVKTSAGIACRVVVGIGGTGSVILYDDTTGTSNQLCDIDTTNTASIDLGIEFTNGLKMVKTGTAKVSIIYQ